MDQQSPHSKQTFTDRYASGLKASVHNNTIAYGFSIMITASLAVVQAGRDTAGIWEVLTFAGGAVLAFTVVEAFVYLALRHRLEEESNWRAGQFVAQHLASLLPNPPHITAGEVVAHKAT